MSDAVRFIPVRGLEETILDLPQTNGKIYFATDTKRIYIDTETQNKLPVGGAGSSGIYYGSRNITEEDGDNTTLSFTLSEISSGEMPNINDLILNIPDGCFYRVVELDSNIDEFQGTRLTVAGSSSQSGESSSTSAAKLTVNYYPNETTATKNCLYQASCPIQFNVTALDASGEKTGSGKGTLKVGGVEKTTFTVTQGINTVDIGEYLALGANTVVISISMDAGEEKPLTGKKSWTVNTVSVQLTVDYDEKTINDITDPFKFVWTATGAVTKTLHVIIDDTYEVTSNPTQTITKQTFTIEDVTSHGLTHGGHILEMYVTAQVGDSIIQTDSIFKQALFRDINSPLVMISYKLESSTLLQYDTVAIPIIIFNPATEGIDGTSTVVLKEEGVVKDTWTEVSNSTIHEWLYTPTETGATTLTIICENQEKNIVINVEKLAINNEEVSTYAFKLKSTEFASNTAVKNWNNNGVSLTFSDNFDWINGGLQTETVDGSSRQYICVKAGTWMSFNYDLFKTNGWTSGKNVKIIFKATNCRSFNAEAIKCYDEDSGIGLIVRAQDAELTTKQTNLTTAYCEDSYLEYEFDVWPSVTKTLTDGTDVSERYLIGWLDGVPCGASVYSATDTITYQNSQNIIVGSDDCDVYLYLIKVYEKHLDDDDHLANFIADAPNASEMLDRFNRNDILDDIGRISPTKLAIQNPDCWVHLYDIDHMTTNKDTDPVSGCTYTQYRGSSTAYLSATNVTIKVQGTSSAAYGMAAFNIDSDFSEATVADEEGNILSKGKWQLDDNAIPVNYFTTKVNVASCECANNAINQEWYNKFQPFITQARKNDSRKRDTMQFYPGVMFVRDHNQTTNANGVKDNVFKDTVGYIADPYYKLYSVCNMGNSKKNTDVLHDSDNPKEVCIEVTDNQKAGQWLTVVQGYVKADSDSEATPVIIDDIDSTENYAAWKEACNDNNFDFRYPKIAKQTEEVQDSIYKSFFAFCKWMAHSDPSPKYNEVGEISEEQFNKYVNGYTDEDGNIVDPVEIFSFNGIKHTKETVYSSTVDYYVADVGHPYGYTDEPLSEPVTFSDYTFHSSDEGFADVLKGLLITDYTGTYTTDCYKYRMAKMLSECEDHLVMDSVVFHYLFIERHTMIDNVAKNTFWGTEDLQHWYFNKDYDNDTADGNDNEGKLSLRYGYEAMDTIADRYVFNAHGAVWFNFINGLYPACEQMYKELATKGAWDPTTYLNAFTEFQSTVPERCWIEDYHRKYLRPLEVYGSRDYIDMLEGGKKTHQRKQFETYQNYYMNSKYSVHEDSEAIFFRANTQGMVNDYLLPVKLYCDCYAISDAGQTPTKQRVKGDTEVNIVFDHTILGSMNDATCHLYPGYLYTKVGDMSGLKPKEVRVTSAKRLQELSIGLANENNNLESVSVGANVMLKKLEIAKCSSDQLADLSLVSAIGLHYLDIRDSSFTALMLPDGAPIETLLLGSNLNTLQMTNLEYVSTFSINNYNLLNKLLFDNIDNSSGINSKSIIDNITSTSLGSYNLKNVDWSITSSSDLSDDNTDGDIDSINILDRLLKLQAVGTDGTTLVLPKAALTGTLTISADAYNSANAFTIYDKYTNNKTDNSYPSLDIIFEGENAKLYTINIYDGNNSLYWSRRIAAGTDLTTDFLTEGPDGAYNKDYIYKSNTEKYTYTFTGKWNVFDIFDTTEIEKGDSSEHYLLTVDNDFTTVGQDVISAVDKDLYFIPIFTQVTRTYNLYFYNYDGTPIVEDAVIAEYGNPLSDYYPNVLPIKDSDEAPDKTYKFKGYGLTATTATPLADSMPIKDDYKFYALFSNETVDVHENVLSDRYLSFTLNPKKDSYTISPASGVQLVGKVTLPISHEGLPVTIVSGFNNQTSLTRVFFEWETDEKPMSITTFYSNCFQYDTNLLSIEIPSSLLNLYAYCLANCTSLVGLNFLNTKMVAIEDAHIFEKSIISTGYIYFPGSLKTITGSGVFYNNIFDSIQFGQAGDPSQLSDSTGSFGSQVVGGRNGSIANGTIYRQSESITYNNLSSNIKVTSGYSYINA